MQTHTQQLPTLLRPFSMLAIEGGTFDMGGESWNKDSLPVHRVELDDFMIGEYPVTQELWTAVMGDNLSYFKGDQHPVEQVSWNDVVEGFLPKLNALTEGARPAGMAYRLPTEAEWEYAARGGKYWNERNFAYSGGENADEVAWYYENSGRSTKPVGQKLPNQLGLFDMTGNVWEWCADWYGRGYFLECENLGTVANPAGAEAGAYRMLRGGAWNLYLRHCGISARFYADPVGRQHAVGFRLVLK